MDEKHIPVCKGGGIFHSHKAQYTKETQQLVKNLLNESKLSIIQKTVLNNMIKNGDPLPKPLLSTSRGKDVMTAIKAKPISLKRTKIAIEKSGAYDREQFIPINNSATYNIKKERLQSLMAYGKDMQIGPYPGCAEFDRKRKKSDKLENEPTKNEMFNDLINEVEERAQFLEDMEKLGEDKKYKEIIETEISSKMRQMEMLDKERYDKQDGTVGKFREKYKAITEICEQNRSLLNGS